MIFICYVNIEDHSISNMSRLNQIEIVDYSEKAIALFGETKNYREAITAAGGKFNPSLKYQEERRGGWIFPKVRRDAIEKLVNDINSGKCAVSAPVEESKQKYSRPVGSTSVTNIDNRAFLALVSRVEQLEQELDQVKRSLNLPNKVSVAKPSSTMNFQEEDEDEPPEDDEDAPRPTPRLLKKKMK